MNKVMLIGNVGQEPDVHYYDYDQCIAHVRLATTERGYTMQNGTKVPSRTDWHNIVFVHSLAKIAEKYVHKGDKIYVEGRLRYRAYDDKKGIRHTVAEIYAENMEFLTPRQNQSETQEQKDSSIDQSSTKDSNNSDAENRNKLPF